MNKQELMQKAGQYVRTAKENCIRQEFAISKDIIGIRLFSEPLFAFGWADDPLFEQFKQKDVIGSHYMIPKEWLAEAQTVISFFLPASDEVKSSNRDSHLPSAEWLHARIEGQAFINQFCIYLKNELTAAGYHAVVPALDERFFSKAGKKPCRNPDFTENTYTSNWSERHAAYVCGLGTFGLSRGLITKKGVAGRLGSVITDLQLPPDKRAYTGLYDYCSFCGACIKKCPVNAISMENGKEHPPCSDYLDKMEGLFSPRYACGKCQTGVPCESRIPAAPSKEDQLRPLF